MRSDKSSFLAERWVGVTAFCYINWIDSFVAFAAACTNFCFSHHDKFEHKKANCCKQHLFQRIGFNDMQPRHTSPIHRARPASPVPLLATSSPNKGGTYAFLSNGKNDDRCGYIRASGSIHPIHDIYYDLPGVANTPTRTPNLSKSVQRGSRLDFQKQIHKPTGLYYELPGMADNRSTRTPNLAKSVFSGERSSFLKSLHFLTREYTDLPGMADEIKRKPGGPSHSHSPRLARAILTSKQAISRLDSCTMSQASLISC